VKSHLLKITNAKAGISSDFDEAENGKPTLKRRQPDPVDGDSGDSGKSSNSSSSEPPKLKKRGEPEPEATPKP